MKLSIAQINPTLGDFNKNTQLIIKNIERAKKEGASIIVFPELAISGYPP